VWTNVSGSGQLSRDLYGPAYNRVSTSRNRTLRRPDQRISNPKDGALSIVAINENTSSTNVSFYISGDAPCSLTPYETSRP